MQLAPSGTVRMHIEADSEAAFRTAEDVYDRPAMIQSSFVPRRSDYGRRGPATGARTGGFRAGRDRILSATILKHCPACTLIVVPPSVCGGRHRTQVLGPKGEVIVEKEHLTRRARMSRRDLARFGTEAFNWLLAARDRGYE